MAIEFPPRVDIAPRRPWFTSMGSSMDGMFAVVAALHPACGLANRCTVPVSSGREGAVFLPDSPTAIRLPSSFTATAAPKWPRADPEDGVSLTDAAVTSAHPVVGFANTYTAPLLLVA